MYAYLWRSEVMSGVFLTHLNVFCGKISHWDLELTNFPRLAGLVSPWGSSCLHLPSTGVTGVPIHLGFYLGAEA